MFGGAPLERAMVNFYSLGRRKTFVGGKCAMSFKFCVSAVLVHDAFETSSPLATKQRHSYVTEAKTGPKLEGYKLRTVTYAFAEQFCPIDTRRCDDKQKGALNVGLRTTEGVCVGC